MNHITDSLLNELLDQILPDTQRQAIESHLAGCAACQSRLEDLRRVTGSLASLADQPLTRDLTPSVLAGLRMKKLALSWKLALAFQTGIALGLVLLAATEFGGWVRAALKWISIPSFGIPEFQLPAFSPSSLRLPTFQIPSLELPILHIPRFGLDGLDTSALPLILLAAGAAVLFVVGNSLLLGNTPETKTSGRSK